MSKVQGVLKGKADLSGRKGFKLLYHKIDMPMDKLVAVRDKVIF